MVGVGFFFAVVVALIGGYVWWMEREVSGFILRHQTILGVVLRGDSDCAESSREKGSFDSRLGACLGIRSVGSACGPSRDRGY